MSHLKEVHLLTSLSISQLKASIVHVSESRTFLNDIIFSNKIPLSQLTAKTSLSKDKFWKRKHNSATWSINEMVEVVSFFQERSICDKEEIDKMRELSASLEKTLLLVLNMPTFLTIQDVSTEMILNGTSLTKDKYYYRKNNPQSWKFPELIELLNFIKETPN